MKRLILILLFFTGFLQAQTLKDAAFANTSTNTLKIKSNVQDNSATKIPVQSADGSINWINKSNLINQTTAGITQRVYFTADSTTVTAGTLFATSLTGKGSIATGSPSALVLADNTKGYFNKDLISIAQPSNTIGYAGSYSGQLTVSASPTQVATQQRFTVEIYRTNNGGTPIASGVSGAPTGDLGVTVIAILDSGIINLNAGSITNIPVSGILTQNITINTGERLRYHVSAAKIGAGGENVTFGVYYGSSYNSHYDVPVAITTDAVVNKSTILGNTVTDALNSLPIKVAPLFSTSTVNPIYYGNSPNLDRSSTFYINKPTSVTNDGWHSISSYSSISLTGATAAHAVFDGRDEITANTNIDHIVGGMQARSVLLGSGNVANFDGTRSLVVHNGSGIVSKSAAYKAYTPQGSGVITEVIGYETEDFGTNKAFYARGGLSIFMGNTGIGTISPGARLHTVGGTTMTGGYVRNTLKEATFPVDVFYSTSTSRYGGISYDGSAGFEFFINSLTPDISTVSSKVRFTNTGTVIASPATLSTELVTKSQLDAVSALDAGNVKTSGSQNIGGIKRFTNVTQHDDLIIFTSDASLSSVNPSIGRYNNGILFAGTTSSTNRFVLKANSTPVTVFEYIMPEASGQLVAAISGSATLNFPSTPGQTSSELTITVTGAADGDCVSLGVGNSAAVSNGAYSCRVSAANTVTVKFNNYGLLAIDPPSGTFKVKVFK